MDPYDRRSQVRLDFEDFHAVVGDAADFATLRMDYVTLKGSNFREIINGFESPERVSLNNSYSSRYCPQYSTVMKAYGVRNGMVSPINPLLGNLKSDIRKEQKTTEYRFFSKLFSILDSANRFNDSFKLARDKFESIAENTKTGIFTNKELEDSFGIANYTAVPILMVVLLTRVCNNETIRLTDTLQLLQLAQKVLNVRKNQYDTAKRKDGEHLAQIHNWTNVVSYLGLLLSKSKI